MPTDEQESQICICGNPRSMHTRDTIHPFTLKDGVGGMALPENPNKRTSDIPTNPTQSIARLIGVLKDKGVIDDSDIVKIIGIPSFKEPT